MKSRVEVLRAQLQKQVERFEEESGKHKRMYRWMRYGSFVLLTTSATLASWALARPEYQQGLTLAIIIVTAAAGLLTSIESLRKPGELWIHERTTYYALKDLQATLEYKCAEKEDPAVADEIFERMQAILGASSDKWNRKVQPQPLDDPKPKLKAVAEKDVG